MAIQPPNQIAELVHARSPELFAPQRHYVAYPVTPGPQACLIEVEQPNRRAFQIIDALTILPARVRHAVGKPNPLYACWLGVIKNFYKADIKALSRYPAVAALAAKTEYDPPFLSPQQRLLAQAADHVMTAWTVGTGSPPPSISRMLWNDLVQCVKDADCWYPQHRVVDWVRRNCEDQWRILMAWETWEKKKMSWGARALDHRANFPGRTSLPKMRGRTTKLSALPDAFEKRCRHMGLRMGNTPGHKLAPSFRLPVFVY